MTQFVSLYKITATPSTNVDVIIKSNSLLRNNTQYDTTQRDTQQHNLHSTKAHYARVAKHALTILKIAANLA